MAQVTCWQVVFPSASEAVHTAGRRLGLAGGAANALSLGSRGVLSSAHGSRLQERFGSYSDPLE